MSIRVAIVDDQTLVRSGLAMILSHQTDIDVIAEAGNGVEAIDMAIAHQPDVILMDIRMPEMDGLEATAKILKAANYVTKVLILTTFDPDEYVYKALRAGASGFVLKDIPPQQLVTAVRTVADGGALLSPSITMRLIDKFARQAYVDLAQSTQLDLLTKREREVLREIALGLNNREISEKLFVGETTIKTHVSSIFNKLNLRDRAQAVVFAYESGVVEVGQSN